MKKRYLNRKGFSMAEMLVVVAIIIVLMGVGFIAIMNHMRSMAQLEAEGHAKEIFVAAQNHLALAESQGYLGLANKEGSVFGTKLDKPAGAEVDPGVYYLVVGTGAGAINPNNKTSFENSILSQMLPFGSMDEAARTKGSYIIRYQKSPAVILDVFYVPTSGRYGHASLLPGEYDTVYGYRDGAPLEGGKVVDNKYRRDVTIGSDNHRVIGYYGGETAKDMDKGTPLAAPSIVIKNEEKLQVVVTDNNPSVSEGNELQLIIVGVDSGAQKIIKLIDGDTSDTRVAQDGSKFTITLDDVTTTGLHFEQLSSDTGDVFCPGENLEIRAQAFNNSKLTNIADSGTFTTNSLFDSLEPDAADPTKLVAKVSNFRHLLNLDEDISALDTINITLDRVEQISDLIWLDTDSGTKDFVTAVGAGTITLSGPASATGPANSYYPVSPFSYTLVYDGKGHKISNVIVTATASTDGTINAGLFGDLSGGSVSNLELIDFNLSAKGNVGALAGETSGTSISGVLVRNTAAGSDATYKVSSSAAAAGGLVGKADGGSVELCAAAVYVRGSGNTGGLIGEAVGVLTVTNSYSGGQTREAKYMDPVNASTTDYAATPINVISSGASAGGLIGAVGSDSGTTVSVSYSYSTASASTAVTSASAGAAGGLIGSLSSTTSVNYCYAVGLVYAASAPTVKVDPFVASLGGVSTTGWSNNWFLAGVSAQSTDTTTGYVTCVASAEEGRGIIIKGDAAHPMSDSVTYDKTLLVNWGGKFNYPTIAQLHDATLFTGAESWSTSDTFLRSFTYKHYGDWQVPSMTPLNFTLKNENKLYSEITLEEKTKYVTLAVQGKTSGQARAFQLQVRNDDGTLKTTPELQRVGELGAAGIVWHDKGIEIVPDFKLSGTTLTVTLDDITEKLGHFSQIFCSLTGDGSSKNLTPGENFTLYVGSGKGTWNELIRLGANDPDKVNGKGPKTDNSLFAKSSAIPAETDSDYATKVADMSSAEIKLFRHLQNLDYTVSDVDSSVTEAKLLNDLNWDSTTDGSSKYINIYNSNARYNIEGNVVGGSCVSNSFVGIYTSALTEFDGSYKTISNLVVDGSKMYYGFTSYGLNNAGLFRYISSGSSGGSGLEVKNLELVDVEISSSSGQVGALAGQVTGALYINNVLVHSDKKSTAAATTVKATGSGAVGGLVGLSSGNLTIYNSASAMFVKAASGDAGGLVGKHENGLATIYASYVGGHTSGGKYYVGDNADGGWNVVSTGGASGGLIGSMSGSAALEKSFSTASVWATGSGNAGGIIGVAGGTIGSVNATYFSSTSGKVMDNVYTVAPVSGVAMLNDTSATSSSGSLVGSTTSDIGSDGTIFFLPDVYSNFSGFKPLMANGSNNVSYLGNTDGKTMSLVKLASFFDQSTPNINAILGDAANLEQKTTAYDSTLKNKKEFPFRMWTTFSFADGDNNTRHFYGDWQPVDSLPTKQVQIHFVTVLPSSTDGKPTPLGAETVAVQIPYIYKEHTVTLPFGVAVFGYDLSDWNIYVGWEESWLDNGLPAADSTDWSWAGSFSADSSGKSAVISNTTLNALKLDTVGEKHLTIVSTYKSKTSSVYKLELKDVDPANPSSGYTSLGSEQVLSPVEGKNTWKQLLTEKSIPMLYKEGYVFRGWYTADRTASSHVDDDNLRVFETYYDNASNSYKLRFNDSFTGASNVVNDNITLRAWYDKVTTRNLTITFVGEEDEPLTGLTPYSIDFDAERGFSATLTLPGTLTGTNPLKPVDNNAVQIVSGGDGVTKSLSGLSLTLSIPALDYDHLSGASTPVKINIKYQGGVNLKGYVVLYELLDTAADGSTYAPRGGSFVYDWHDFNSISDKAFLYDAIKEGDPPKVTTEDGTLKTELLSYVNSLQPSGGFQFMNDMTIYTKEEIDDLALYKDCYAKKITKTENGVSKEYDVDTVVVIRLSRRTFKLTFDANGANGGSPASIPYVYGMPLKGAYTVGGVTKTYILGGAGNDAGDYAEAYTPSYTGYTFHYWELMNAALTSGEQVIATREATATTEAVLGTTMPARDATVRAYRTGEPVTFSILFWLQNTKDDNGINEKDKDYTSSIYISNGDDILNGKELKADAGSSITVTPQSNGDIQLAWIRNSASDSTTIEKETIQDKWADLDYYRQNSTFTDATVEVKKYGTVANIYYDRKVYTLRFYLGFGDVSTTSDWVYEAYADSTAALAAYNAGTTIYGIVDGQYKELSRVDGKWVYTGEIQVKNPWSQERYLPTTANEPITQYGIVGGQVVEITLTSTTTQNTGYIVDMTKTMYKRNTTNNNGTRYGITSDGFVLLQRRGNSSNRYWTLNGTSTIYTGHRFETSTNFSSLSTIEFAATTNIYYANATNLTDGQFSTTAPGVGNAQGQKFVLLDGWYVPVKDNTGQTVTYQWKYNGDHIYDSTYPRYLRKTGDQNMVNDGYSYRFISGANGGMVNDLIFDASIGWYYPTTTTGNVEYRGSAFYEYKLTTVESGTYYVSNVTNSTSGGGYDGFFTSNTITLSTSENPFVGYYTGTAGPDTSTSGYTVYYKDITARYGADIYDEWPDIFAYDSLRGKKGNNSAKDWYFIGWITHSQAYYYQKIATSSIKGKIDTMSKEYLLVNGIAKDTTQGDGIAQVFHCRYSDYRRMYIYRKYFWDPETEDYSSSYVWNPKTQAVDRKNPLESKANGGAVSNTSGSTPADQSPGTFYGYKYIEDETTVLNSSGAPSSSLGSWSPYDIPGYGSGMIINFYFKPHQGKIELYDSNGQKIDLAAFGQTDEFYYGQSLAFVSDYDPTVDSEHVFRGWYTDPEGAGTRYDPNVERFPDTEQPKNESDPLNVGLRLYAVVKPTDKTVTMEFQKPADADDDAVIYIDDGDGNDDNDVAAPTEPLEFSDVPYGETLDKFIADNSASYPHSFDYYTLKLDGYTFGGWQYTEGDKTYNFYSSDPVENTRTLTPVFTKKVQPDPVKVYVVHVDAETKNPIPGVQDTPYTVTIGEPQEFIAEPISGYQCVNPTGKVSVPSITQAWLDGKLNTTANRYEVTIEYKIYSQAFDYGIEYYLYLPDVNDAAQMITIPVTVADQYSTGSSSNNYAYVNFYALPDDLSGLEVKKLELFDGTTKISETTDPVIFVTKGSSVKIKVYVAAKASASGEFSKTQIYNGQAQEIDIAGVTGVPSVPSGLPNGAVSNTVRRYYDATGAELAGAPTNAGVYDVQIRRTITYDGATALFWESQEKDGRHGGTFFIDRCDVTLTSADVIDVFASYAGYDDREEGDPDLPNGATISDLAKANAQSDVTVELPSGISLTLGITYSFSADAFRRTTSTALSEYTSNVFDYTLTDPTQAGNFNFYKVYGKLYIWEDYNLYRSYMTQPAG